jgi:hypothetical protein
MWSVANMHSKTNRARIRAHTAATFKAMGDPMAGKDEVRTQGLAERSVNTSIVHPSQSNPDHREQDDPIASNRIVADNQQREGLEKTDSARPTPNDRHTS